MTDAVKHLPPAYFALVMATGIISIAARDFQLPVLAMGLFAVNLVAYAVLSVLTGLRAIRYPRLFFADMTDHRLGPGFFTTVAGSCILGTQVLLMTQGLAAATVFLALGVALWIVLTYTIFTAFTVKHDKPPIEQGLTGAWLIAVLAALVARDWPQPHRLELNFFALSMWLWGGMFYIWIISLIFYRYSFFAFSPSDLSPPYWNQYGGNGDLHSGRRAVGREYAGRAVPGLAAAVHQGFTVFYWATGTWWIPMLLVLDVWQHVIKRFPLRYDPLYWGAVFPLGMYTVATRRMAEALDLPSLAPLPPVVFAAALAAWTLAFVGLLWELRKLLPSPR
jgi:tellurite resistance protein TehA-like permease